MQKDQAVVDSGCSRYSRKDLWGEDAFDEAGEKRFRNGPSSLAAKESSSTASNPSTLDNDSIIKHTSFHIATFLYHVILLNVQFWVEIVVILVRKWLLLY